jgi:hypothetical protein
VRDAVTELDDDMTKSAPVEMLRVFVPVIELDDDMTKSAPVEMLMLRNPVGGSGLDINIWALHVLTAYVAPDIDRPEVVYKEPAL